MPCDFYHLHTHTKYSVADAMIKPKELAKFLNENNIDKYAITEHGAMFNMPEFYSELKDKGIELIVGMEAYVAPNSRLDKNGKADMANHHLVLLAENDTGYKNLLKIASDATLNGFYRNPRTDRDFLEKHHEGLIATSACLGGSVQRFLSAGMFEEAKADALNYERIFGKGNFYLEIQRHDLEEQDKINPDIVRLSRETGIPLVATNDCHYLYSEDWEAHDVLMAIQGKTTIYSDKRKKYGSKEFYVKTPKQMKELFFDLPEAIENTVKIANRCHVELDFGENKIPPFKVPKDYDGTNFDYLKDLVYRGIDELYGGMTPELKKRADYELEIINKMGYVNYFLITWDFFRYCKTGTYNIEDEPDPNWVPILTGPGRGSAAGSIVAYATGITKIDPIKYNLLFERFLDVSRIGMPDIDSDFQDTRRQEVIDYVIYKYGRNNISQVITFNNMTARAVIRDVGRALDLQYSQYDSLAKMIPKTPGITIRDGMESNPDLKNLYENDEKTRYLLDIAMKLEGLPKTTSTHAAGILITDDMDGKSDGVTDYVPLWKNDSGIVSQYDKVYIEKIGLLKMDFLGLKTLGIIAQTFDFIKKNHGITINLDELYKVPDEKPFELIRDGKTSCIFQLESSGMTNFMTELQPKTLEDLTAGVSLFRPGPMSEIPKFLYNKRHQSEISYPLNGDTREILEETYGILTYQEQCMRTVVKIAGYSKADSDGFRKVIGKKKEMEIPLHEKWFIYGRNETDKDAYGDIRHYTKIPGGINLGYDEEELKEFFNHMRDFGRYAFNKSHAACYAVVAYVTAWLKYYYPAEFMAANLNYAKGNPEKISKYARDCREMGIDIVPPSINSSETDFIPIDGKIEYGLNFKGVTTTVVDKIIEERNNNGEFKSLIDFLLRTKGFLDKSTYEGLIASGALKPFSVIKSQMLACLDEFWDGTFKKLKDKEKRIEARKANPPKRSRKNDDDLNFNFAELLESGLNEVIPDIKEFPENIQLNLEKELLGVYLSGNPLYKYSYIINNSTNFVISDIDYDVDEFTGEIIFVNDAYNRSAKFTKNIKFIAILDDVIEMLTKKKQIMARVTLEDLTGTTSAIIWPDNYANFKPIMKKNGIYLFEAKLEVELGELPSIFINSVSAIDAKTTERIIIHASKPDDGQLILNTIKNNRVLLGSNPTYIKFNDMRVLLSKKFWLNAENAKKFFPDSEIREW